MGNDLRFLGSLSLTSSTISDKKSGENIIMKMTELPFIAPLTSCIFFVLTGCVAQKPPPPPPPQASISEQYVELKKFYGSKAIVTAMPDGSFEVNKGDGKLDKVTALGYSDYQVIEYAHGKVVKEGRLTAEEPEGIAIAFGNGKFRVLR